MAFKRFGIVVVLLSVLVGLSGSLFFWALFQEHLLMTRISTGAIWLFLVFYLIHYVNKTNLSLNRFLQSVRSLDSSKPLHGSNKDSFEQLGLTFNEIIDSIQKVRIEKESEYQHFNSIIDHVPTGLITFDAAGKIHLINKAAAALLQVGNPLQLDELEKKVSGLPRILREMKTGESSLHKLIINEAPLSLSIRKTLFVKQKEEISLIALQNIRSELEEEELEVWQKLISVLTHEIMNSVSPLKSLTGTLIRRAERLDSGQERDDMLSGLNAIKTRSRGLLSFVDSYRNLSRIPVPVFSNLDAGKLLKEVAVLMQEECRTAKVSIKTSVSNEALSIRGDEKLLSQVLINLVGNAIFALEGSADPCIDMQAMEDESGRKVIVVQDNGKGIPEEIIHKIFIPFYTTRENGSGIGLSLARQIMHMHHASIQVSSTEGKGSRFSLIF